MEKSDSGSYISSSEFIFETFKDIRSHLNDEEAADEDEDDSEVKKNEKKGDRKETDTGQGSFIIKIGVLRTKSPEEPA